MRRHLEVVQNFEHQSPGFMSVEGGNQEAVRDISQELIERMSTKTKSLHGTLFRQIFFSHGKADDIQKPFRDWANEVARLTYGQNMTISSSTTPNSIAIQSVTDAETFKEFLKTNQHDPFANWHTDPYDCVDHVRGLDIAKLASTPRHILVFGGPGTIGIKGLIRVSKAHYFIPPHSNEITYENNFEAHKSVLVGADGQFLRGPVLETDERANLGGEYEIMEAPNDTWIDVPPTCVHAVPMEVPIGRTIVIINHPQTPFVGTE